MKLIFFLAMATLSTLISSKTMAQTSNTASVPDKLVVVWTSDDPYVAERVALMYTHAAKTAGWFSEVTLIIWGPSAKLTAENLKVQEKLKAMQTDGVVIEACIACADAYGIAGELKKLNFDVKAMGKPLTDYLKSGAKVLTF
ncbi:MAG: DsrE family protein [Prolixibacteraceae bacterium]